VVRVDSRVALARNGQVHLGVASEKVQHMLEKRHAHLARENPRTIQIDTDLKLCFLRVAFDSCGACSHSFCPW